MPDQNRSLRRRVSAAYGTLRGRPLKPDYGILVIMPLLAAAGGVLISRGLETALDRRRAAAAKRV
jgi:hypothetical protein